MATKAKLTMEDLVSDFPEKPKWWYEQKLKDQEVEETEVEVNLDIDDDVDEAIERARAEKHKDEEVDPNVDLTLLDERADSDDVDGLTTIEKIQKAFKIAMTLMGQLEAEQDSMRKEHASHYEELRELRIGLQKQEDITRDLTKLNGMLKRKMLSMSKEIEALKQPKHVLPPKKSTSKSASATATASKTPPPKKSA